MAELQQPSEGIHAAPLIFRRRNHHVKTDHDDPAPRNSPPPSHRDCSNPVSDGHTFAIERSSRANRARRGVIFQCRPSVQCTDKRTSGSQRSHASSCEATNTPARWVPKPGAWVFVLHLLPRKDTLWVSTCAKTTRANAAEFRRMRTPPLQSAASNHNRLLGGFGPDKSPDRGLGGRYMHADASLERAPVNMRRMRAPRSLEDARTLIKQSAMQT
jgi:hypothetical protein